MKFTKRESRRLNKAYSWILLTAGILGISSAFFTGDPHIQTLMAGFACAMFLAGILLLIILSIWGD